RVDIFRDGATLDSREVRIGADGVAVLSVSDSRAPGQFVYTASVEGDDGERPGAVVTVGGQMRVLYVSEGGAAVAAAIEAPGVRLTRTDAGALPPAARGLAMYDLVVLDAVAADRLEASQADAVASYVDGGGGLLVLGSAKTLDMANLAANRLGSVLPVDLRPRGGRRAPSTAFVFVFDKS